jgi:hypothetical protein
MKKLILILLLLPAKLYSANLGIGTAIIYTRINDPKLSYINNYENIKDPINAIRSVNINLSNRYKRIIYGIGTNRLLNSPQTRAIKDTTTNYHLRTSAKLDTINLGYLITPKIASFITVGNLQLKQKLIKNGSVLKSSNENAILYGLGTSYATDKGSFGLTFIAPSQAIKMEWGLSFNYTINFKL